MASFWVRALPPEPDRNIVFNGNPGVRNMPDGNASPITYFLMLFTVGLMKEIVRRTNRYFVLLTENATLTTKKGSSV